MLDRAIAHLRSPDILVSDETRAAIDTVLDSLPPSLSETATDDKECSRHPAFKPCTLDLSRSARGEGHFCKWCGRDLSPPSPPSDPPAVIENTQSKFVTTEAGQAAAKVVRDATIDLTPT